MAVNGRILFLCAASLFFQEEKRLGRMASLFGTQRIVMFGRSSNALVDALQDFLGVKMRLTAPIVVQ